MLIQHQFSWNNCEKKYDTYENDLEELKEYNEDFAETIFENLKPKEKEEEIIYNEKQPKILLTTFVGSKGLSAAHVFIVGANNGTMPKIKNDKIEEVEISKFLVALSRTRICCHIVSNKWFYSPVDKEGKNLKRYKESEFIKLIEKKYFDDLGCLKANDI